MSLASAIALATGLDPEKDFEVRDDSDGTPPKLVWDTQKLGPVPSELDKQQWLADYEAKKPERDTEQFARSIQDEYVTAMIYNDLLKDSSRLTALIAKADAFMAGK